MGYQTFRRNPILQGTTPKIKCQIVDEDGEGFKPDTLTMTIYDVVSPVVGSWPLVPAGLRTTPLPVLDALTESIVNSRNDVDVLASCDAEGNVVIVLESDDTDIDVPGGHVPATLQRRILFTWTWDSTPTRVGKHEVILTIAPDRETVAS